MGLRGCAWQLHDQSEDTMTTVNSRPNNAEEESSKQNKL